MTLIDPVVGAAGSSFIFQRIIVLQKRDKIQKKIIDSSHLRVHKRSQAELPWLRWR